ncbi:hypothetical protein HDU99_002473, partial [Rhizoclosmatium hyalinum]
HSKLPFKCTPPALVPTANPAARASLAPLTAPDVVAGTPWNLADFAMASAESEARKRVRDPGQVSQNEVAAAEVRAFTVGLEFVPAAVGVGAAAGTFGRCTQPCIDCRLKRVWSDYGTDYETRTGHCTQAIEALQDNNGMIPAAYPPTTEALKSLQSAPLNALLTAYDMNVNGTLQIRRARLGIFL